MKLLIDLFSTDYGMMSLVVIVAVIVIGVYMVRAAMQKIYADSGSQ